MACLAGAIKRGFLRQIFAQAQASQTAVTLGAALLAFQANAFSSVQSGRLIVSTSGNGKSVAFSMPTMGQIVPDELMSFSEELFEVYSDALTALGTLGTDPNLDPPIFAQMLLDDRMQTVTEVRMDFTPTRLWTNGVSAPQ
jgi:hypothetical protein